MTGAELQQARFRRLCTDAMLEGRTDGKYGFGTLAEKRMHAVLKKYICPDTDFHEVGLSGTRYLSDVRIGKDIWEIQTGDFSPMKRKISYYLSDTDCNVTVVHPITVNKWVSRIRPETFDIYDRRKSPKHERPEDLLPLLYPLLPDLGNPRLRFRLLLLEAEEFRLPDTGNRRQRRRGSIRYERIPLALLEDQSYDSPQDFLRFLPETLPDPFTVRDFSRATKILGVDAYSAVRVLAALGVLAPAEPIGRAMAFRRKFR